MSRTRYDFATVRSEGALLPPDLLSRIQAGDPDLPALTPKAYHLPGGMRLNEAAARSWNALLGAWSAFRDGQARLPEGDPGTSVTRERWLLPLFQELGYGRLEIRKAVSIDGKNYALSHAYKHAPIHLVGCNVDLDRRTAGVAGAAAGSPHSLLQEFLNRREDNLWGVASNGLRLRILRDNLALTRQAYLEFDLEAMMDGEAYSDFVLLYLTLHQSRLEADDPHESVLEAWSQEAAQTGTRVLKDLSDGVETAIRALGEGFLRDRGNTELKRTLRDGTLATQDYYRQLLRLVYRLLFLFVAEDRDALHPPDANDEARERYAWYGTRKLREQVDTVRGGRHPDAFERLKVVFHALGTDGAPELGLPALGSFLFSDEATPDVMRASLPNAYLYRAVRALAYAQVDGVRRTVDYKNLGSEELGGVYEGLLELHPEIDATAGTFHLGTAAGNERKTSGSYYTATGLITLLLDSALDPVLDERTRGKTADEAESALLETKIVDPACGSGHFLIAAAQRMGKRLARIRTADDEPAPEDVRSAVRDVVGRCVYGVDVNPMSAELCKVALWMEALEPGKPLSFLDHRIRVGNSLIGTSPRWTSAKIPRGAYTVLDGDSPHLTKAAKGRNEEELGGQIGLFSSAARTDELGQRFRALVEMPDSDVELLRTKENELAKLLSSESYERERLAADAWCSAFVWRIEPDQPPVITTGDLLDIRDGSGLSRERAHEINVLAREYGFFHFEIAFPEVFRENGQGGFDVVLGNPPWERFTLQEKEWFAGKRDDIASARTAARRKKLIAALEKEDPELHTAFVQARRKARGMSHFVRASEVYPLCGHGSVNTYALFAERNRSLLSSSGRTGFIVPSGIVTDHTTRLYFQDLMDTGTLVSLVEFDNSESVFPGVDRNTRFCLLTASGQGLSSEATFVFGVVDPHNVRFEERQFTLDADDIERINPNTRTCPVFRSSRDAEIVKSVYARLPVLVNESTGDNPWNVDFFTMFDMAGDSDKFRSGAELDNAEARQSLNRYVLEDAEYLPLYEGKMVWQFNHRFANVSRATSGQHIRGASSRIDREGLQRPDVLSIPRYWVRSDALPEGISQRKWVLAYRRVGGAVANARTSAFAIGPEAGYGDSLFLVDVDDARAACVLVTTFNSFVLDYILRNKMSGINLSFFIMKQLPVLLPASLSQPVASFILRAAVELSYTAWDLAPFARECGFTTPPFKWNEDRRFRLRAELDALLFHLYGIARDDVSHIMGSFPIVERRDVEQHGSYRTRDVILSVYDNMARAEAEGRQYEAQIDPPPSDSSLTHDLSTRPEWLR